MISDQQILGIDDGHLVAVIQGHKLQLPVKTAFLQMQLAAKKEGHDLQLVSSFRSFQKQASIWQRKWQGELPLNTVDGKILDTNSLNDEQKMHAILLWSALPGGSRHHWGTDFDVFDESKVKANAQQFKLVTSEYEADGPCASLSQWLRENAEKFGFSLPYAKYIGGVAPEPWHLSFTPIASEIVRRFSINVLQQQLLRSNISGLDMVISDLPEIFERYTLNRGIK
ncbi:MAG: LAS superfamily LD-carboxypeptidase LdcB [Glaciecola sp.]|jgi:LAS superfamily LD-carboxypeptidase LdcB